jgi:hypothetical protein
MITWHASIRRARRELRSKRPLRALVVLERAGKPSTLTRTQRFESGWLRGVALRHAGLANRAMESFVQAARERKRSYARRRVVRMANGYGMVRQGSALLDDREAFFAIQLARYVSQKHTHRLGSYAEIDVVTDLIEERWRVILSQGVLSGQSVDAKLRLFSDEVIVFPFLHVPNTWKTDEVIVDFPHHRRPTRAGRCPCGSGLPFGLCCGRIPGTDEVVIESN